MESFYDLMQLKQEQNSEVFALLHEERRKYKMILDDSALTGTISHITNLFLKTHTSESTMRSGGTSQNMQNELDKFMKEKDTT